MAVQQVVSYSSTLEGRSHFADTDVIRFLCRMIGDGDLVLAKNAATALINFANDPAYLKSMIQKNVISRLLDGILEQANQAVELYAVLLSNVTRDEEGVAKLLQVGDPLMGFYATKLTNLFLQPVNIETAANTNAQTKDIKPKDKFSWIASILLNVTSIQEGRKFFLEKQKPLFKALLAYIESPNIIRRRGILGFIRNCLFESQYHEWLLGPEVELMTLLLLPLRNSETYPADDTALMPLRLQAPSNKPIESNLDCQKMIVDCLTLVATTPYGREFLRAKKAYPIVRDFHKVVTDDTLSDAIFTLVENVLLAEDFAETEKGTKKALMPDVDHSNLALPDESSPSTSTSNTPVPVKAKGSDAIMERIDQMITSDPPAQKKKDLDEKGQPIEEI